MRSRTPRRTSLAAGALTLALLFFVPLAAAETNACFSEGWTHRPGILEASLDGKMVAATPVNMLEITVPESLEPNKWSRTTDGSDRGNEFTDYPVFVDPETILVPADEVALIWLEVKPPETSYASSLDITRIRFEDSSGEVSIVDLSEHFQQAVPSIRVKKDGNNVVIFCDDNSGNPDDRTWEFSLLINGERFDPQIKNKGSGPPPPVQRN